MARNFPCGNFVYGSGKNTELEIGLLKWVFLGFTTKNSKVRNPNFSFISFFHLLCNYYIIQ